MSHGYTPRGDPNAPLPKPRDPGPADGPADGTRKPDNPPTCGTCRYAREAARYHGDPRDPAAVPVVECRRQPITHIGWPTTSTGGWCGEWADR